MICDPETLLRLSRLFIPDGPAPVEWFDRLAKVLQEHNVDEVDVVAYLQAMFLHSKGLAAGNPAIAESVRAPFGKLEHFGSAVTVVIQAEPSERVIGFYREIGVTPVLACDSRAADAEWTLPVQNNELPTPALLAFVDRAVQHSTNFVWGFPRVQCKYDVSRDELRYSQFLPFGPLAGADRQWRLSARSDGPKERRTAPSNAILLDFDWVARPFAERVKRVDASRSLASLQMHEAIPEAWHMWANLGDERFERIARDIHRCISE